MGVPGPWHVGRPCLLTLFVKPSGTLENLSAIACTCMRAPNKKQVFRKKEQLEQRRHKPTRSNTMLTSKKVDFPRSQLFLFSRNLFPMRAIPSKITLNWKLQGQSPFTSKTWLPHCLTHPGLLQPQCIDHTFSGQIDLNLFIFASGQFEIKTNRSKSVYFLGRLCSVNVLSPYRLSTQFVSQMDRGMYNITLFNE